MYRFLCLVMLMVGSHGMDICRSKQSCSDCIQTPDCVWCFQKGQVLANRLKNSEEAIYKCSSVHDATEEWCPRDSLIEVHPSMAKMRDEPVRGEDARKQFVQLRPQEITLKVKVGVPFPVDIEFRQAQNYPIDLYYLMDLSKSMQPHKKYVAQLGVDLIRVMSNITTNFRVGFGSFVDKPILPFTDANNTHTFIPCRECQIPYSYKNHLPLTTDTELFSKTVIDAPISGNIDLPEGGLEALMQVIVCQKEISWRKESHKLLVLSTDEYYHLAGDGKLAGIVEPNDELCHLNNNGDYTHAKLLDYPSLGQINRKSKEHNINIIFAVPQPKAVVYGNASLIIKQASVGVIDNSSSNIVQLVYDEYNKISETITLTHNATEPVTVEFEPVERLGVKRGTSISFKATIRVDNCNTNDHVIQIKPSGLPDTLMVSVTTACECPCEQSSHPEYEKDTELCSKHGDMACGVCKCHEGYISKTCKCKGTKGNFLEEDVYDENSCRPDNTTITCSGHGVCVCGSCLCRQRPNAEEEITGDFCECDNYSCPKHEHLLCSGPDHGSCKCKTCVCLPGWTGDDCSCSTSNYTCFGNGGLDTEVCSGKGTCKCGKCTCDPTGYNEARYTGKYCEECKTCPGQKCAELNVCVKQRAHQLFDIQVKELNCEETFYLKYADNIEELHKENPTWNLCTMVDEAGCTYSYVYYYKDEELHIKVQSNKNCPTSVNLYALVGGISGATVLFGLLTLIIWKILTACHDHREYMKFEKEKKEAKFGRSDNPLYKKAVSTFQNPTFRADSKDE